LSPSPSVQAGNHFIVYVQVPWRRCRGHTPAEGTALSNSPASASQRHPTRLTPAGWTARNRTDNIHREDNRKTKQWQH